MIEHCGKQIAFIPDGKTVIFQCQVCGKSVGTASSGQEGKVIIQVGSDPQDPIIQAGDIHITA